MPLPSSTVTGPPKFSTSPHTTSYWNKNLYPKKGSLDFSVTHISYIHTLADTTDCLLNNHCPPFRSLVSGPTSHDWIWIFCIIASSDLCSAPVYKRTQSCTMWYMRKYTDNEMYEEVNRKVLPLMRGKDTGTHTKPQGKWLWDGCCMGAWCLDSCSHAEILRAKPQP